MNTKWDSKELLMTPGANGDSTMSAKKEWRRPDLRKLAIADTAGSQGHPATKRLTGDEGQGSKNGDANYFS
jgi:hypothetical protein